MTTADPRLALDEAKLNTFFGQVIGDWGGALGTAMVVLGDKLGLYEALQARPLSVDEVATRTDTHPRYVREWLLNQAAAGYVVYDPATARYSLPPEHAVVLAQAVGGFQTMMALVRAEPRIASAFRTGEGMLWGEHDSGLFEGTERFFRPGYEQNLVQSWIPALDGIQVRLETGAVVADVGCGHGASTIILAQAFPRSRFVGFDNHAPSIARARQAAQAADVGDRVSFDVAAADGYPRADGAYDLIAFFDCLHDMGNPVGALRHAAGALATDGAILLVEPMAGEHVEDNFNPVGRVYSGASVLTCTPNALASGGQALGTLATEAQLRAIAAEAGLSHFRRAAETPFNRVFEAKVRIDGHRN
jgi:SAM-dependent methyltransferase